MNLHKGFTVLEVLLSIFLITLVVTIVIFSFSKLNSKQALDKSATLVISTLDEARSLTLSSVNDSQYGVHFENDRMILFKGPIYSSSDLSNVVTELNSLVSFRNIILYGGGVNVVFKRLTGEIEQAGTVELFLKATPQIFRTITIENTGMAESD